MTFRKCGSLCEVQVCVSMFADTYECFSQLYKSVHAMFLNTQTYSVLKTCTHTHTQRTCGLGGVYFSQEWLKERQRVCSLPIRDRFSHKSVGLIHSLPRTLVVCVVETQESLKARLQALFVFGSLPHHSYWCRKHTHAYAHTRTHTQKREDQWKIERG